MSTSQTLETADVRKPNSPIGKSLAATPVTVYVPGSVMTSPPCVVKAIGWSDIIFATKNPALANPMPETTELISAVSTYEAPAGMENTSSPENGEVDVPTLL